MGELTDRDREWCRLVAGGMSQAEAYRKAFNRSDMGSQAAYKAGHRLSKKREVVSYLDSLRAKADVAAVLTREARMQMLSRMAVASEAKDVNKAVNCLRELNKMDGAYAPEKIELSSDEVFRREVLKATGAEPMVRSHG